MTVCMLDGWNVKGGHSNLPTLNRPTFQSGKRDSNPRPQPWQGCALPTELFPRSVRSESDPAHELATRILVQPSPKFGATTGAHCSRGDGGEGDRTPDLVNAIHALSQLSYAPSIFPPPKRAIAARGEHGILSARSGGVKRFPACFMNIFAASAY